MLRRLVGNLSVAKSLGGRRRSGKDVPTYEINQNLNLRKISRTTRNRMVKKYLQFRFVEAFPRRISSLSSLSSVSSWFSAEFEKKCYDCETERMRWRGRSREDERN